MNKDYNKDWKNYFQYDPRSPTGLLKVKDNSIAGTLCKFNGKRKYSVVSFEKVKYKANIIVWLLHNKLTALPITIKHLDNDPWNNNISNLKLTNNKELINKLKESQMLNNEEFKLHETGCFAVSRSGKVLGKFGRLLKPRSQGHYLTVGYSVFDGSLKRRNKYVHRLVAEVWVDGQTVETDVVNHKDFNKLNNDASNLEWVSSRDNNFHTFIHGRVWNLPKAGECGFRSKT